MRPHGERLGHMDRRDVRWAYEDDGPCSPSSSNQQEPRTTSKKKVTVADVEPELVRRRLREGPVADDRRPCLPPPLKNWSRNPIALPTGRSQNFASVG